jgi:hypothetical protein
MAYRDIHLSKNLVRMTPFLHLENVNSSKGKAIPLTDREGLHGCETSRIPHLLDNRLTDGRKFVSFLLGIHFCLRLCQFQGHSETGRIR